MGINAKARVFLKPARAGRRAVFVDRDGVLNHTIDRGNGFFVKGREVRWTAPYRHREFKLKDDAAETLNKLGDLGFLRIVVTNQPDLAYGLISKKEYDLIMADLTKLPLDDIFVCLHGRDDGCDCRKPKPGMFLEAAKKWEIDLAGSFMIGDALIDMEAGKAAGCKTILVEYERNKGAAADVRVQNLLEAVRYIRESR